MNADLAQKNAVEANRKAIMTLIENSGPQDFQTILKECKEKACGHGHEHEDWVWDALDVLIKQGALFQDTADDVPVWDLPDQPWDKGG